MPHNHKTNSDADPEATAADKELQQAALGSISYRLTEPVTAVPEDTEQTSHRRT